MAHESDDIDERVRARGEDAPEPAEQVADDERPDLFVGTAHVPDAAEPVSEPVAETERPLADAEPAADAQLPADAEPVAERSEAEPVSNAERVTEPIAAEAEHEAAAAQIDEEPELWALGTAEALQALRSALSDQEEQLERSTPADANDTEQLRLQVSRYRRLFETIVPR